MESSKEQKTKIVELREFPSDGLKKANILINCHKHWQKQRSFVDATLLEVEDVERLELEGLLEEVSISASGLDLNLNNLKWILLESDVYVYAKTKGCVIPQPLKYRTAELEAVKKVEASVTVFGTPFYDFVTCIYSRNGFRAEIGDSLDIISTNGSEAVQLKYSTSSNLRALVKDLDFMLSALVAGQFELNGQVITFDDAIMGLCNFDMTDQKELLAYHKKMVEMFDLLGVRDDIDLTGLSEKDRREIDRLITALIDLEPVNGLKPGLPPLLILQVSKFKLLLGFTSIKGQEGSYKIYDYFAEEKKLTLAYPDGKTVHMSPYAILEPKHYIELANIRFDEVLPSFQRLDETDEKYEYANRTLLNLLRAYDICERRKSILLETAEALANWLLELHGEVLSYEILCLNRLQVIKRKRQLTPEENLELLGIVQNHTDKEILVGAHLLLGQKDEAERHYKDLELEVQEEFRKYPIWYFWEND